MEIITDLDKLLDSCIEIDIKKQGKLAQEITLALKREIEARDLVALSAPQLGYGYRIFCVKFVVPKGKKKKVSEIKTFINPIVDGIRGVVLSRETCESIPGKEYILPRNTELSMVYQTPMGKIVSQKFTGKSVSVIQQQLDLLDGVFISDTGLEIDSRFDEATEEERDELLEAYLKALDLQKQELDDQIEGDKDLKSMSDAIKFIQSVRSGETQLGSEIEVQVERKDT